MDKMSEQDLRMWVDTASSEPWLTLGKVLKKLDKDKKAIDAKWGDSAGEVYLNGKIYKR